MNSHTTPMIENVERDPKRLKARADNSRQHSKKQLKQLERSICTFGFYNPVTIDEEDTILAGHGRVQAALSLGLESIPCRRVTGFEEGVKLALMVADNKLALNATYDEVLLAANLVNLRSLEIDATITGFSVTEIEVLIDREHLPDHEPKPEDDLIPEPEPERVVSQSGDIWVAGSHRLFCGDSLLAESYDRLLGSRSAEMIFTDPPYNLDVSTISGLGKTKHRNFEMGSGEMSEGEFEAFLKMAFAHMAAYSKEGAIHFICMDWRHLGEVLRAGAVYDGLKNLIVWDKGVGGMGSFFRNRHELIFAFKKGSAPHINNFELGQHGRSRTNVWSYRGVNTGGKRRMEELALHPTCKPVQMIADAMRDCSTRGGVILDAFGGVGSTMIAAEKTGRRAHLIEIDPIYVDRAVRRWQAYAKDDAILEETGETFDEVAKRRHTGGEAS